jgi:hypothetical protein
VTNFLLGYGERLVENITIQRGGEGPKLPYSFSEARKRLAPQIQATARALADLPDAACPRDEAVALLTLHPQFLAKSYHPGSLLHDVDLEVIGSRPKAVKPEKWTRKKPAAEAPSTELYVAGPRSAFRSWAGAIEGWVPPHEATRADLQKIEAVHAPTPEEKVQRIRSKSKSLFFEIGLHLSSAGSGAYILEAFARYADTLGVELLQAKRLVSGSLCFLPARGERDVADELARFTFLRVLREMPKLRHLESVIRVAVPSSFRASLPDADPVDSTLRVAVLDGGTPRGSGLERWVTPYEAPGIGPAAPEAEEHGAWVNSAALFGPLSAGQATRPFAGIDHFRVLDEVSGKDAELYDVMHRVRDIARSNNHVFLNLSIGPDIPVEDDQVHAWTCMLDELLADGTRLVTVAAGNGGENDAAVGNNRVLVPADGVNALSIGAADSRGDTWARAPYSSIGPGRSPGVVKPDALFFGGSGGEPFRVFRPGQTARIEGTMGTSFAAPSVIRLAAGVKAHFGDGLNALAIRALLVHCAEDHRDARREHGWGRLPEELDPYVVCPEGCARVVFQGEIAPGEWLRAPIPVPSEALAGFVTVRATFCYATKIDPSHPTSYTQSGLVVTFRPNDSVRDPKAEDPQHAKSEAFFQLKQYGTEQELRRDAHKWETVLHREKRLQGSRLQNPCFDINYQARSQGQAFSPSDKLRYALVITITAPRVADLYNRIVRRYQNQLRPLEPVIQIPIRARR